MTAQDVQKLNLELTKQFDRAVFMFLDTKPGDEVDFEFNYSGDAPILGIKKSCGCMADFKIDGGKITGTYSVGNSFSVSDGKFQKSGNSFTVYFDDGTDFMEVKDGLIKENPLKPRVVLRIDGEVTVE